jgi:hypothetical protein
VIVEFKKLFVAIALALALFVSCVEFKSSNLAFGQFFENPDSNGTNYSNSTSDSTSEENGDIVLLSQKLKKASYGYRDLVGQVKNIGGDDAEFVNILLTIYDKNGGVIGTDSTYADADTLKPGQKSSFKFFTSSDDFKGMDHYDLSLEWNNPDGSQGYVENAKIFGAKTAFTETSDDTKTNTDTNTNTGTQNTHEFPQTNEYCNTVKTQLGKELCDKLLG